jgi:hypothetical protein
MEGLEYCLKQQSDSSLTACSISAVSVGTSLDAVIMAPTRRICLVKLSLKTLNSCGHIQKCTSQVQGINNLVAP